MTFPLLPGISILATRLSGIPGMAG
jgi:hypothetical protein